MNDPVWCGDDVDYDVCDPVKGEAWSSTEGDASIPTVRRPIGFLRRKPVIRVKAGSQPIITDW